MNTHHLKALRRKHSELEDAIRLAEQSPATDDLHIRDLKKRKLAIKDEMEAQPV